MKYVRWLGLAVVVLIAFEYLEKVDAATKAVVWSAVGLGYGLYIIASAIDANHKQTLRMLERLEKAIDPRHQDDIDD